MIVHAYSSSHVGGKSRRIMAQGQPGKSKRPSLRKKLKIKGLGAMASGRRHEILNLGPSTMTTTKS
jgi:hypothetical protein